MFKPTFYQAADFIQKNKIDILRKQYEGSLDKVADEIEDIDLEMDRAEEMAQFWRPEEKDDAAKLELANQFIDLNRKLRGKIGDLMEGLDGAIRRMQERRD